MCGCLVLLFNANINMAVNAFINSASRQPVQVFYLNSDTTDAVLEVYIFPSTSWIHGR